MATATESDADAIDGEATYIWTSRKHVRETNTRRHKERRGCMAAIDDIVLAMS
jgi:hypothetical protein